MYDLEEQIEQARNFVKSFCQLMPENIESEEHYKWSINGFKIDRSYLKWCQFYSMDPLSQFEFIRILHSYQPHFHRELAFDEDDRIILHLIGFMYIGYDQKFEALTLVMPRPPIPLRVLLGNIVVEIIKNFFSKPPTTPRTT